MDNIIFITTDEQHLMTISACGAMSHTTPNMDFLLHFGTQYKNAYTSSPVCLPSRCCWMTGMEPHHSGSVSNNYGASLSTQYSNLFLELKKGGFITSLHGKCHFSPVMYNMTKPDDTLEYETVLSYYRNLGMDELDVQDGNNVSLWFYDDYAKYMEAKGCLAEYREKAHMHKEYQGVFPFPCSDDDHPDAWTGRKTLERIQRAEKNRKNFVWCSFSGPHYPIDTPDSYTSKVNMDNDCGRVYRSDEWNDGSKYHFNGFHGPGTTEGSGQVEDRAQKNYSEEYWVKWRRAYFGNVLLIDEWIGRILEAARSKWGDGFAVVFTSDHGEMMGNHSLWGKNGALYEDVLKVPLAVWVPGQEPKIESGRVQSKDVHPTILKLAKIDCPTQCDGIPLDEAAADGGRRHIVSSCDNCVAVLKGPWKLEWNLYNKTGRMYKELYNLDTDPNEFENLYGNPEYIKIIRELETYLWEKERTEKFLTTVFRKKGEKPYFLNDGEGSGLLKRQGNRNKD